MNDYDITIALPGEVEKTFSKILNMKEDIISLIVSAEEKKAEFEELVFTAKYIIGLLRVSDKNEGTAAGQVVTKEISESIIKLQELIKEISGDNTIHFENKYFRPNPESLRNLTLLLADLELIKLYLNDLKRKS